MSRLELHPEQKTAVATAPAWAGAPSAGANELVRSQRVSVVVPALNEAENLPHVLPRIPAWVYEVILVDGHSTDNTVEVARALWPDIRVVPQEGRGKGAALRTGFAAVTGDIIVMLDADGSTDPAEIPAYVGALLSGADFVKGSRFLQGGGTSDMPIHRRWGNGAFVGMVRVLFSGRYSDLCYGYNAFWAWTVPRLRLNGDGFEIETQMNVRALQAGLKVAEVPSFEAERVHGVGRLRTIPDGWRVLNTIYREWTSPNPPWADRQAGTDRRRVSAAWRGTERRSGIDRRVVAALEVSQAEREVERFLANAAVKAPDAPGHASERPLPTPPVAPPGLDTPGHSAPDGAAGARSGNLVGGSRRAR